MAFFKARREDLKSLSLWLGPLVFSLFEPQGQFDPFVVSLGPPPPHAYSWSFSPSRQPGSWAERFELRAGDCFGNEVWNDCQKDRERIELKQSRARIPTHKVSWFQWSFFLPESHPNVDPVKLSLAQFHQENMERPPLMLQQNARGLWLDLVQISAPWQSLIEADELRGRWHDLKLQTLWSTGDDGLLRVWVNGELRFERRGPNLVQERPLYFKYGLYRSFLSRQKINSPLPTQTMVVDAVTWSDHEENLPRLQPLSCSKLPH